MQRLPVPVLFALLIAASPAAAQQAPASAVIQIGEVMSLRAVSPDRVEVVSNVAWRLIVVAGDGGDVVTGARPDAVVVTRGSAGRVTLAVEPEWLDPARQGFSLSATLRLALAPD